MILRFRSTLLCLVGWAAAAGTCAQEEQLPTIDTLIIQVAEVRALRIPTPADKVAGNIHLLEPSALQNGHSPDLQDALNSLPGVYMETRGIGGSRRLQMRSSGLRSPFGVRNIIMVMDGFVLTNASGNSPLEMWNPQFMQRLEVMKGPVGALYGNAYGGALVGSSLAALHALTNETKGYTTFRSSGLKTRITGGLESGFQHTVRVGSQGGAALHVRMLWNDSEGYRDQEYNQRHQAELHWLRQLSSSGQRRLWLGWMDAAWGLPGSLNADDAGEHPTSATGLSYDAHVHRARTWVGWSQEASQANKQSGIWLYGQTSTKHNPFGTSPFFNGLKDEAEQFASLRWWQARSRSVGQDGKLTWDQSIIARYENLSLTESDAWQTTGTPRYAISTRTMSHWAAIGGRLEWGGHWQIDAQFALENMQRDSEGIRRVVGDSIADYLEAYRDWDPLPFVQLTYQVSPQWKWFAQWGNGGSHPTSFELVDPEGFEPYSLRREEAHAFELGSRWTQKREGVEMDLAATAYHQRVRDAIAQVPGPADGLYMANVEGLRMSGVEFTIGLTASLSDAVTLQTQAWGALNRHAFEPYAQTLPGTPLHTAGTTGFVAFKDCAFGWKHQWLDQIKLHNYLDDWTEAHHRLNLYVDRSWSDHNLQLGVRNALNASYSSWVQTNAFGGRYFNPAPPRTIWLTWRWQLTG